MLSLSPITLIPFFPPGIFSDNTEIYRLPFSFQEPCYGSSCKPGETIKHHQFHIFLDAGNISFLVDQIRDQPAGFFNISCQSAVDDWNQRSFPCRMHFVDKAVIHSPDYNQGNRTVKLFSNGILNFLYGECSSKSNDN
jgi:hypothetical protein